MENVITMFCNDAKNRVAWLLNELDKMNSFASRSNWGAFEIAWAKSRIKMIESMMRDIEHDLNQLLNVVA